MVQAELSGSNWCDLCDSFVRRKVKVWDDGSICTKHLAREEIEKLNLEVLK